MTPEFQFRAAVTAAFQFRPEPSLLRCRPTRWRRTAPTGRSWASSRRLIRMRAILDLLARGQCRRPLCDRRQQHRGSEACLIMRARPRIRSRCGSPTAPATPMTRSSRSTSPTATRRRRTLRFRPTRWRRSSANGTIVGQLSAVDPDASDTATYSLVDNAGGRFAIDGSNIVVAGALDYESSDLASGHGAGHRQRRQHL